MSHPGDPATRTRLPEDEYRPHSTRRRPWVGGLAALTVAVLLVIAFALSHTGNGPRTNAASTAGSASSGPSSAASLPPAVGTAPPPTGGSSAVAVGYPDTESGARSAAANYVVALGSDTLTNAGLRHGVVAQIADPSLLAALQSQFDAVYAAWQQQWSLDSAGHAPPGLTFVSRLTAMGVATDAYKPDRATIDVWTVGLVGLAGPTTTKPVSQTWNTEHVTLHWIDGDWKWASSTTTSGPVPVAGIQAASPLGDVAGAVSRFGGLRYGG